MSKEPSADPEVQELVQRFATARARRRRLRLAAGVVGGVLVVATVVVVVLLTGTAGPSAQEPPGRTAQAQGEGQGPGQGEAAAADSGSSTTSTRDQTSSSSGSTSTSATAPTATTASSATKTTRSSSTTAPAVLPPAAASAKVVVIDPGHQGNGNSDREPIGPGSSTTKAKVSSGTAGVVTGIPESELVLAISLKLRDALTAAGVEVVMTRTTQDVDLSNIQRAMIANQAGADLFVRVHADGNSNTDAQGIHVLYPAVIEGWTDDIAEASKMAAVLAQRELVAATGANDRGIDARSDMTGFNWADVPVILPEIGFMTNPTEDRRLATPEYQDAIVTGLVRSILEFVGGA